MSWSGAHPTGGIVPDPNSTAGEYEEYPLVLLECRGTASGPDEVSPETCWTQDAELPLPGRLPDEPRTARPVRVRSRAAVVGEPSTLPSPASIRTARPTRPARAGRRCSTGCLARGRTAPSTTAAWRASAASRPRRPTVRRSALPEQRDLRGHRRRRHRGAPIRRLRLRPRTPRSVARQTWPARWSPFPSWASAATPTCRRRPAPADLAHV